MAKSKKARPAPRRVPRIPAWLGRLLDPSRHSLVKAMVILTALGFLYYRDLWKGGYYKDDYMWVKIGGDIVRSPGYMFTPTEYNDEAIIRVSQRLLMALAHAVSGTDTRFHHVLSIILHIVVSVLVFRLLLALHQRPPPDEERGWAAGYALLGAVLFVTTHSHDMAVVWMSSQSTLLAACVIVPLMIYLIGRRDELNRPAVFATAVAVFLLALYSKNTISAFPVAVGAYFLLCPGAPSPGAQKSRYVLVATLVIMSLAHLLFTKTVLGDTDLGSSLTAGGDGKYALSTNVPLNLVGGFLATVLAADVYPRLPFSNVSYVYVSLGVLALLLVSTRFLRFRSQMLFGLAWIFVMVAPITLFDYHHYDSVQVSVSRYYYVPFVGMAILLSFLLRATVGRLPWRRLRGLVLVALVAAYAASNYIEVRANLLHMNKYGDSRGTLVNTTLDAVDDGMPEGTVVYAIDWKMDDFHIQLVHELFFEPKGVKLEGMAEFRKVLQGGVPDDGRRRFMALHDVENSRFGIMEMQR